MAPPVLTRFVSKKYHSFGVLVIAIIAFHASSAAGAYVCLDFKSRGTDLTNESQARMLSFFKAIAEQHGGLLQIEVYYPSDSDLSGLGLAADRAQSMTHEFLTRNDLALPPTPWIQILLRVSDGTSSPPTHCAMGTLCTLTDQFSACAP